MVHIDPPARPRRSAIRKRVLNPTLCTLVAAIGIFGGISQLFVGLLCTLFHDLIPDDVIYDRVGTGLLILAIPFLLIGSIFLEEIKSE